MKESRAVRDAIELISGRNEGQYEIKGNKIVMDNGAIFTISILVARRLIELGY